MANPCKICVISFFQKKDLLMYIVRTVQRTVVIYSSEKSSVSLPL